MDRRGDAKSREMMLDELLGYDHVTIQCHDNPDADAIASGYGLYCFFRDKGKDTRLLYSGRNKVRKANLMLMVEKLHIPLEYQPQMEDTVDGLLITVDCQYGAGNVTELPAEEIAVIDHHPLEVICTERMRLKLCNPGVDNAAGNALSRGKKQRSGNCAVLRPVYGYQPVLRTVEPGGHGYA